MLGYIGPGSGFAISVSLLTIVIVLFSVVLGPIAFPISMLWHVLRGRRVRYRYPFRKVVVIGLDGLDAKLVRRLMAEGKLPNFRALAGNGSFSELQTVAPALTPAAWSSFLTGVDPSRHGIYDFITRDRHTYLPRLTSSKVVEPRRLLAIGKYRLPLSRARTRMLRKGVPFWRILGEHRLETTILRVPITFPAEPFKGRLLSGMCVPDLRGTQGTYTCYATSDTRTDKADADYLPLHFADSVAHTHIPGPEHPFVPGERLTLPLAVHRVAEKDQAVLGVAGRQVTLAVGQYSPWVPLSFRAGLLNVRGIAQFYLKSCRDEFQLYMTPLHIDPEGPAMPLSHPSLFGNYLAKRIGSFGTLGLIEDTTALTAGVLDEDGFLQQAWRTYEERKAMFFRTLETGADDVVVCVFDTPDRIQHMFWRWQEPDHPAMRGHNGDSHAHVIDDMLIEMDGLIGQTLQRIGPDTLLLVLSDHGFVSFRRTVDLNAWLHRKGYLYLLPDAPLGKDWLEGVDWSRTRAYALGLTGIFINLAGREARGIVSDGPEFDQLAEEIKVGLESLMDEQAAIAPCRVVRRALITSQHYSGPYRLEGPDLIVGFEAGYRCSWECARGQVTDCILRDNTRRWSGDHCVDPQLVPGVLMANAPLCKTAPCIIDMAPTILDVFGIPPPPAMQGSSLLQPTQAAAAATGD